MTTPLDIQPDIPAAGAARRPAAGAGLFAWCLFDWAASAYNTVIGTFIFSVYFARGIYGDETAGSAAWGQALGVAGLLVAILSPILGAIADRSGRRKPWLALFLALTVVSTALLWFAAPSRDFVLYALTLVVLSSVAFELAGVFYNAMLPEVAPPSMLGRVSGWGWGLGYAGGLACLAVALFGFVQADPPLFGLSTANAENVRAVAPLVAVWCAAFALPLFLFTPDAPPTGIALAAAVREGLATLANSLRQARRYGQIVRFLIASALYRDGLNTLFAFGGLYAAGTFGMSFEQILIFAIGLNVTAGLGAAGFAFLDDRIGPKPTILIALVGLIGFGVPILLVARPALFIALALGLGIFVGPVQAASRTMMARLAPPGMAAEMFGLYAMTGRAVSVIGPFAFAAATSLFGTQRAGMATILVVLAAGGLLLLGVRPVIAERPAS